MQTQHQLQPSLATRVARSGRATPEPVHQENLLLQWQHTIGNQAVQRMMQARAGEQRSRIVSPPPGTGIIQKKLTINEPGDEFEQEADRVAEQVMRMPEPQVQRSCSCGGTCPECQAKHLAQEQERLQTKRIQTSNIAQEVAPPSVHEVLNSPGQPLDATTRAFMEPRFDHDFSPVRVHSGATAEQSAREVHAHAYTVGQHIVFAAGQFAPATQSGQRLLAHELAHVVQQSGNKISTGQKHENLQRQPEQVFGHDDRREELKKIVSSSRTMGDADLKAQAQREVNAGGDLNQLWNTINSSRQFTGSPLQRLIYARYFLQYFLKTTEGREPDEDEIYWRLFQLEEAYQQHAEEEAHKPVDEAIIKANERARQEYQENVIKQEIAKLQKEQAIQHFPGHIDPRKYPGIIPHGLAPLTDPTVVAVLDTLIYFIPVVGEARGIVEAIVGFNLITEEKLGILSRLLSALPLAPLALKGGKLVIGAVNLVINTATEKAALILAISQRAGKDSTEILTLLHRLEEPAKHIDAIREARAAIAEGRNLTKAQRKALEEVDEALHGIKRTAKVGTDLVGTSTPVHLAGETHALSIRRIGNQLRFQLCSISCGELIEKAEAMLARLPKEHAAQSELSTFINQAQEESIRINEMSTLEEAQGALERLQQALEDIQRRYPGAVDPNIPVTPASPATTAEHVPVVEPTAAPTEALPIEAHEESSGVPEPISEDADTQPIRAGERVGERVGQFVIGGDKRLNGQTFEREILGIYNIKGRTRDIRPIMELFDKLIQEARAAGATELRVEGSYIRNPNVYRLLRLVPKLFGGTGRVLGPMKIEIIIPVK